MNWWQRLIRGKELERQLDSELRFHFDRQVADYVSAGMSAGEARRAAALRFGLMEGVKEECRDARGTRLVEIAWQDTRYAFRVLRRSPAFTIVALLCLAIGIGANTAIFSIIESLMLRQLPVRNPEQLVLLGNGQASGSSDDFAQNEPDLFSWPFYQQLRGDKQAFSDVLAIRSSGTAAHVRFGDRPSAELERARIQLVSANYFKVLAVAPSRGRVLNSDDDRVSRASPVAVMRYGYWESRFAKDPAVVGKPVFVGKSALTIVGVAAPDFFGTTVGSQPDFWVPLSMQELVQPVSDDVFAPLTQYLWLIGRLHRGVSISQAQASINVRYHDWLRSIAGSALSEEQREKIGRAHVTLTDASRGISRLRQDFSRPLLILMALVGIVLLIACANIANLLLARASARRREMALRFAIGASRQRVLGQLLGESLLLALLGGLLGVAFSIGGVRVLLSVLSAGAGPPAFAAPLNSSVLIFTLGTSVLTGLIFGTVPALYLSGPGSVLKVREGKGLAGSRAHNKLGRALVVLQIALAFFLIFGAALFTGTLEKLEESDLGFQKNRVLLFQLDSDPIRESGPANLLALYKRLEARIQALPGVDAASFSEVTFNEGHWRAMVWPEGVARSETNGKMANGDHVGKSYLQVLGTPVLLGRSFGPQDTPKSRPVAIVNETFAHSLFPNGSPLGRHFSLEQENSEGFEIIGVVKNARYEKVKEKPLAAYFILNDQNPSPDGYSDLVIRTRRNPQQLIETIRKAVHAENPGLAIWSAKTLSEQVIGSLGTESFLARLSGFFALVSLTLACIGLYGVLAYSVAQRRKEIGIRMALGARPSAVLGSLLSESSKMVGLGLLFGVPAALACGRMMQSELSGVAASDPKFLAGSAALLMLTALAASFLPGRKAASMQPLAALREE